MDILIAECGPTQLDEEGKCVGQLSEPLSLKGVAETAELVAKLPEGISHIFTSPQKPALELAHAAAKHVGLGQERFVGDGKLMARRFTRFQRKPWAEVHKAFREMPHEQLMRDYGVESDTMFHARVAEFVTTLKGMRQEEGKFALVVTHRDVIAILKSANYPFKVLYGDDGERDTARATLYQFTI